MWHVVSSNCLPWLFFCVAAAAVWTLYRCFDSWASHKKWSARRRRLVIIYGIQLAAATVGLTCYLISNALVVSPLSCRRYTVRSAIYWLSFVRWSCWNTTFLMITIRAHSTTIVLPTAANAAKGQLLLLALGLPSVLGIGLRRGSRNTAPSATSDKHASNGVASASSTDPVPGGAMVPEEQQQQQHQRGRKGFFKSSRKRPSDMLVLDLPWLYHWPKMLLWLAFEACHAALASFEDQSERGECCSQTVRSAGKTTSLCSYLHSGQLLERVQFLLDDLRPALGCVQRVHGQGSRLQFIDCCCCCIGVQCLLRHMQRCTAALVKLCKSLVS